jgi:3-hydroxyisobutyrate dehydrogenase-like beta-hydroxyacid dehydrogenase
MTFTANTAAPQVGILYPGELGSTLGRLLAANGCRVVTTLEGRGPRTARLCQEAGLHVLPSLSEVVRHGSILFSTVTPGAALAVAERCAALGPALAGRLYVDVNSISPMTATAVGATVAAAGAQFVDGAVHGLASLLPGRGTLYLSGPSAEQVAGLFGPPLQVRLLGQKPGQASAFKMLISGLAKGVVAVFLEMGLAGRRAGLLAELLACYREAYPGIMALVERMLPTYPQHAARRAEELGEVEQTLTALGLQPCLVPAARELTARLASLELAQTCNGTVVEVLNEALAHGLLHRTEAAPGASRGDFSLRCSAE